MKLVWTSAKAAAAGIAVCTPIIVIEALPIWGFSWIHPGVDFFLGFVGLLFLFTGLAAFMAAIATFPLLLARSYRARVLPIIVFAGALSAFFIPAVRVAERVRMHSFHVVAQRADPVIAAIEKYVANAGAPPARLQELVPAYISSIPSGLPPLLEIQTGPETRKGFNGNEWILSASVSWLLSFDRFLYFPNQQYPQKGYGGTLERIGKWAYVHE
jgi:hypothetical protein